jgi:adenylate kinase
MKPKKAIVIAGVPGVGKSTVARLLSERLDFPLLDLTELVKQEGLIQRIDQKRETEVIDLKRLKEKVLQIYQFSEENVIIEGHYAYNVIPKKFVSHAFILRKAPWKLKETLETRGYTKEKVRENVEAELVDVCLVEALEALEPKRVCEINATNKEVEEIVEEILSIFRGRAICKKGVVDWLESDEARKLLEDL